MKFLFFLFPLLVLSQEQTAKGLVLDKETKEPIPYVNISILESQIGTSSDEDGSYSMQVSDNDLNKVIKFSSLGYESSKMPVSLFLKARKIFLEPLIEQLDEVVISEKFENEFLKIQPFQKNELYGGFGMGKRPWQIGLYFPYDSSYSQTEYLKEISVLLSKGLGFKRKASKFRVRLFSVSQDNLPEQDLINENIIVTASKKQKEVIIDLTKYNITFPENGIYVTLEGLAIPFNEIKRTYTMIDADGKKSKAKKEKAYVPSFKAFLSEPGNFLVVHYFNGKWWKYSIPHPEKNKQFVPAISLTLSN